MVESSLPAHGQPKTFRSALAYLESAQKSGVGVPPYTRYVNRPWGRAIAASAHVLGLSPNQVSFLSFGLSLVGIGLLAGFDPSPATGVIVGIFLMWGYATDSADGQLARLRGTSSPSGEWLDHVIDQCRQGLLHGAVVIYLYRFLSGDLGVWIVLVPLTYGVVVSTRFISQILAEQLRRSVGRGPGTGVDPRAARRAWLQLPSDPGVLCLAFLLAGAPAPFFWVYTVLMVLNGGLALLSLWRRYAELKELS